MRTLLLLRHGKALGAHPEGPEGDEARPLTDRGRQQATDVGILLRRLGLEPDVAFVSVAQRTRETADLALAGMATRVTVEAGLYNAPAEAILDIARGAPDDASRVLLVGHNPGIAEVARLLEGSGEPQAAVALQDGFPTGTLAVLEFTVSTWSDLQAGSGLLARLIVPDRSTAGP